MRKNLTSTDKGSIILAAKKEGISCEAISETFGISLRTVQRYAGLREEVFAVFDGKLVTYSHCKLLAEVLDELPDGTLDAMAERVRDEELTVRQLRTALREVGCSCGKQGRPTEIASVSRDALILRKAPITSPA
jgi:transposase